MGWLHQVCFLNFLLGEGREIPKSRSSRHNLQFPLGRGHRLLRSAGGDLFLNLFLGRKGSYV